jgi:predicted AAA+ superfamily ATPase
MTSEKIYPRSCNLPELLKKNSFFLFGPRATGKTHLIQTQLGTSALVVDLLKVGNYQRLSAEPSLLEEMIRAELNGNHRLETIVLDEVQKLPVLLDEVHRLIETYQWRFLLCGSSARKLKKEGSNLLAGRAWRAELFPLTAHELGRDFDLDSYLQWGGLPRVHGSQSPSDELEAYTELYLKEEILQESVVRNLPKFSNFLKLAALGSGHQLHYQSIASDIGVSAPTVREYYQILKDTLLAFELLPFNETKKRKSVATSKVYLFDPGVTQFLSQMTTLERESDIYGQRFEQWVAMELRAYLSYRRRKEPFCFWRTQTQQEVDFVIGNHTAIEVKSAKKVNAGHLKGLLALQEEKVVKNYFLVSQDPILRETQGITCLPVKEWISRLWADELF